LALGALFLTTLVDAGDITDIINDCVPAKDRLVEIEKVTMEGCDALDDIECKAVIGDTAKGKIYLLVNTEKIEKLDCTLVANIMGINLPWPCPEKDGCKSLENGQTCPLKKNDHVVYDVSIEVPKAASMMAGKKIKGTWKLSDGEKTAVCIEIPMKISKGPLSSPASASTPHIYPTSQVTTTEKTTTAPTPKPPVPNPNPGLGIFASMVVNAMPMMST